MWVLVPPAGVHTPLVLSGLSPMEKRLLGPCDVPPALGNPGLSKL